VYTIGVGSDKQKVPFPEIDVFGRKRYAYYESRLDEETLTRVAEVSGGLYFRATDPEALGRIYERISEMEKTEIETEVFVRHSEVGPALALVTLLLLLGELIASQTVFLRLME
jgi:Ca-activated chloride channel family protein